MFKFFKSEEKQAQKNDNQVNEHHNKSDDLSANNNSQVSQNAKKEHGVDGVCCGGCGGQ